MLTRLILLFALLSCGKSTAMIIPQDAAPLPLPPSPLPGQTDHHIGVLMADTSTQVPSRTDGVVTSVHANIGDIVTTGQLLIRIDDRAIEQALAIAIASTKATKARAKHARSAANMARSRANRHANNRDILSGDEIETLLSVAMTAETEAEEAKAAHSANTGLVRQLKLSLSHTAIRAPFPGRISRKYVSPGTAVSKGTPVVLLAEDSLRVDFVVPARDKIQYRLGTPVWITIESSSAAFKGSIRRISPDIDPVTQMIILQADFSEKTKTLQAGAGAWVSPREQ